MRDPLRERPLPCRDLAQQRVRRDLQIRTRRRPPGGRVRPRPAGGDLLQCVERRAGFREPASCRQRDAPRVLPHGPRVREVRRWQRHGEQLVPAAEGHQGQVRVVEVRLEERHLLRGPYGSRRRSPFLEPYLYYPYLTLRSEEHTSELQSQSNLVCRLLLE